MVIGFPNYGLVLAFLHVVATNSTPNPRHSPSRLPVRRPLHQHGRKVAEVKVGLINYNYYLIEEKKSKSIELEIQ